MPTCRQCNKQLKWNHPYDKKKSFYENTTELNGKPHNCPMGGPRQTKLLDIYDKCELCDTYYEKGTKEVHMNYHLDDKVHRGGYILGLNCFEDEVVYDWGLAYHVDDKLITFKNREEAKKYAEDNHLVFHGKRL